MKPINDLLTIIILIFLVILIVGLVKPWYTLWFVDKKNRLKVLIIFGTMLLILILFKIFLVHFSC